MPVYVNELDLQEAVNTGVCCVKAIRIAWHGFISLLVAREASAGQHGGVTGRQ